MKRKISRAMVRGAVASMLLAGTSAHAITVSLEDNAATLAQKIKGTGITITGGETFNGAPADPLETDPGLAGSSGTFASANSIIGIDSGIVLSTGGVLSIPQANTFGSTTGNASSMDPSGPLLSDTDLATLLPNSPSSDNYETEFSSLKFKFKSSTGRLYLRLVFASEEYDEPVRDLQWYDDVMGVFLEGPNHARQNIAFVPSTSDPISVNRVNASTNPGSWGGSNPPNSGNFPFEFDGFTVPILVSASGLDPSLEYELRIVVGDVSHQTASFDISYDTAVFIEEGSLSAFDPTAVPDGGSTLVYALGGLLGMVGMRRRKA